MPTAYPCALLRPHDLDTVPTFHGNRKTLEREAALKAAREAKYPPKRGRGRPKGSKNKKKEVVEASIPVG